VNTSEYANLNKPTVRGKGLISQFVQRYQAWSQSMRFLLWVAIVLIAYFAVIDPLFSKTRELNVQADVMEHKMIGLDQSLKLNRSIIEKARKQWGNPDLPPKAGGTSGAALQKVITSVLQERGVVSGVTIKDIGTEELLGTVRGASRTRTSGRGSRGPANDPTVLKLEQTKTQVQFSASPDVVSGVIADLEKNPKVAFIQRISLTRDSRRPVLEVTLVVQSWNRK